jgi:hypothetical protein
MNGERPDWWQGQELIERRQWEYESLQKELNVKPLNDLSFDELVPSSSRYLAKTDVGDDGLVLTIKGFRMETLKGDSDIDEEKMVLHFAEPDVKPMVLNRTNSQLIGVVTGAAKAGDAIGKKILVFNDKTIAFGGRITGGLRIRAVTKNDDASRIPF